MKKIIWILIGIGMLALAFIFYVKLQPETRDKILLLYPDHVNPLVLEAWKNITEEEGLQMEMRSNNEFLYSKSIQFPDEYKGIILSDQIQTKMSKSLVDRLQAYVKNGGSLFLIYDAGTQNTQGQPLKTGALFSNLLALNYAVANKPNDVLTSVGPIGQRKDILDALHIPPGKCIASVANNSEAFCGISSYSYGVLTYPYFRTQSITHPNDLLLTTPDHQFIAGVKKVDRGTILFVNLPLIHLWENTDAMLIHAFLHYFAVEMLHLPMLSPVPDGVGGIIMNQHVESKDALDAFVILEKWGVFKQGPYSMDFTAGPDLEKVGDNKGLDVLHNTTTQYWIHHLASLGHAIGSDGGWAHNYFGLNVSEQNQNEFERYLTLNNDAMAKVLGKKIVEYVPPMGNQPNWATRYLEKQGFLAYYTTSNTGTAPTRNFRNGVFDSDTIWSFPVLPFGRFASIRDLGLANIPVKPLSQWLVDSTDFVAAHHTSRLIYFHPTDILFYSQYLDSLKVWLLKAKTLTANGSFHWYSMTDMAQFLNARKKVTWTVKNKNTLQLFDATHPTSLKHQAWLLDKASCNSPTITLGSGVIKENKKYWIVVAGDTKHLAFSCKR